eukprot:CAMPEP_0119287750 /NCGR_PEP_ID=MMETSP1329-20130426/36127_1 /TAXON_ID=114041 /ORGANISM="Genus nov. species nov., Strain RCC1024" /LENGTH=611 /DNA_ID=CAMNT_0007288523 /DNA_START=133 /DNA_END=1964 /DNA_ORIENTATION=+
MSDTDPLLLAFGVASVACLLAAVVLLRAGDGEPEAAKAAAPARPKYPNGRLQVFFGTQTGTAEGYARTLKDEARGRGFDVEVVDLEDFEEDDMADAGWRAPVQLFAMATYGEGEPTDNARAFVKWCKRSEKAGDKHLEGTKFAVFGLGNRQYEHFNSMGTKTDAWLAALGGERCHDLGLGDDDADLEADFDAWREGLWAALGCDDCAADAAPSYRCVFEGHEAFAGAARAARKQPLAASAAFYAAHDVFTVAAHRELRSAADGGSTVHVELAGASSYETADTISVLPANTPEDVARVAAALKLDLDAVFAVSGAPKAPFPSPCTVRAALENYCDLTAAPRRGGLQALVKTAARGLDMTTREWPDREAFAEWVETLPAPTVARAVEDLAPLFSADDAALVWAVFLDKAAARLQPRAYTGCSSAKADAAQAHVVCARSLLPKGQAGVCSAYLGSLDVGAAVKAVVRPSAFRPPKSPAPVLLVGPGTGAAPFRAILRERAGRADWPWGRDNVPKATLYFGCKEADKDHLYRAEMEGWLESGALDALHVAYSRAQRHKVYVQDLLRRPADAAALAADVVDANGYVYVCGATAMGAAVLEAVKDALAPKVGGRAKA